MRRATAAPTACGGERPSRRHEATRRCASPSERPEVESLRPRDAELSFASLLLPPPPPLPPPALPRSPSAHTHRTIGHSRAEVAPRQAHRSSRPLSPPRSPVPPRLRPLRRLAFGPLRRLAPTPLDRERKAAGVAKEATHAFESPQTRSAASRTRKRRSLTDAAPPSLLSLRLSALAPCLPSDRRGEDSSPNVDPRTAPRNVPRRLGQRTAKRGASVRLRSGAAAQHRASREDEARRGGTRRERRGGAGRPSDAETLPATCVLGLTPAAGAAPCSWPQA